MGVFMGLASSKSCGVIFLENVTVGHLQRGFIIDLFLCQLVPCWFTNYLCLHFQAEMAVSCIHIP